MAIIVDDDEATRESLRFLLESEGIDVEEYASGVELVAAPSWPPKTGCMVLDLQMPGMDGIEVLEALRDRGSQVQVLLVTGNPSDAHRQRALAAGAIEVLEKPVTDGRIVDLVHRALEHGQAAA